jgi:hypothetical protein
MCRSTQSGSSPRHGCPHCVASSLQTAPFCLRLGRYHSVCQPSTDRLRPRMKCNFPIPPIAQHSRTQSQDSELKLRFSIFPGTISTALHRMLLRSPSFPLPSSPPPPAPLSALFTQRYDHNHPYPLKSQRRTQHSHPRVLGPPLRSTKKPMRFACVTILPLLLVLLAQTR